MDIKIKGEPKPQGRHRYSKRGRKIITYDPSSKEKKAFGEKVKQQYKGNPKKNKLSVSIIFNMKRPKIHYRTGKYAHKLKKDSPIMVTNKPDIDNLIKFVLDACNKILWEDDKIICEVQCRKIYSENPSTEIEFWEI
jgi:Holliday junction resolvase RusA-like endonuclease